MENAKISPQMQVALDTLSREVKWELLVKYHGSLQQGKKDFSYDVEYISSSVAIVFINASDVNNFSQMSEVEYIEFPERIWYETEEERREICLNPLQRNAAQVLSGDIGQFQDNDLYGEGILVAVIDSGIDYAHPDFRKEDGSTRIVALWDQTLEAEALSKESEILYGPPEGFVLGTLFSEEMINEALRLSAKEEQRERVPSFDFSGHGTHVTGIAAGNGRGSNGRNRGVAPLADLLIVKLGDYEGVSFPRTSRLLEAIRFSIEIAQQRNQPLAINISFGNNSTSHRGMDIVSQQIDQFALQWKTVLCVGMGNEGDTGKHKQGRVLEEQVEEVEFSLVRENNGFFMRLWRHYEDEIDVRLVSPEGNEVLVSANENRIVYLRCLNGYVAINNSAPSPYEGLQEMYFQWITMEEETITGRWLLQLIPKKIILGEYDIWMPAGNIAGRETRFLNPSIDATFTMPSTSSRGIGVGAYNSKLDVMAPFSGRGRNDRACLKPDLVAPGVDVLSASPNDSYAVRSGTSMATPFVTGGAALLMEWGLLRGNDPYLYGEKMKVLLRKSAQPLGREEIPDNVQGFGALCLSRALEIEMN